MQVRVVRIATTANPHDAQPLLSFAFQPGCLPRCVDLSQSGSPLLSPPLVYQLLSPPTHYLTMSGIEVAGLSIVRRSMG